MCACVCARSVPQEVLWALVGLVDAAVGGGGRIDNPHVILGTLVPILQLLHHPQLAHLSHIAALVARVLHVLAAGDDFSRQVGGARCVPCVAAGQQAGCTRCDAGGELDPAARCGNKQSSARLAAART